ncbi:sporulation protein YqfD [Thalassobacillus sp. C254]|uniref:sporulation protein YqfD n=1 Tax=Thalassobacillus sp. C254 TaxID=1225341 RepID=UPI0006CFAAC4|nr:sporulation protein YqfD [Thalassobacillus sp. C254]
MKNQWIERKWNGTVVIKVEGLHPERFINSCLHRSIPVWSVTKAGNEMITCQVNVKDIKHLRQIAKETECRFQFQKREGLPFLLQWFRRRLGFTAGACLFVVLLYLLSNMVWDVQIDGASPQVEHELKKLTEEIGVTRGAFQFTLPSPEELQLQVTNGIEEATWIGVEVKGTTYHFHVVEQTLPEEAQYVNPRHLVAKKKAVVHDIFVEHGQAQVKPNDFVNKGDMLVSGFVGKGEYTSLVAAKGQILGEIWYKAEVEVPKKVVMEGLTGEEKRKYLIKVFDVDIPLWGFTSKEAFESAKEEKNESTITIKGFNLPFSWQKIKYRETEQIIKENSKEEASKVAEIMGRHELHSRLPEDAEIIGEKVLHEIEENGKVKLVIHYQVIEDITSEAPIIQGD